MAKLSTRLKGIIDRCLPQAQEASLGSKIYDVDNNGLFYIYKVVPAASHAGIAITIPFACQIEDAIVQCTVASGTGTITVKNGSTAITDAMVCAEDKVIVRAGTIDNSVNSITTSTVLTAITHATGDAGTLTLVVRKV